MWLFFGFHFCFGMLLILKTSFKGADVEMEVWIWFRFFNQLLCVAAMFSEQ